jgi:hypothetical protein
MFSPNPSGAAQPILWSAAACCRNIIAQASVLALPGSALQKAEMLDCGLFRGVRDSAKWTSAVERSRFALYNQLV